MDFPIEQKELDLFKVNDVNKTKDIAAGKVKKNTGGADFSSYLKETAKPGTAPVSGMSGISVTDAIFAAQLADGVEERERKKKQIKRGFTLLDKLEEIRQALLGGYISVDRLIEISRFVKEQDFGSSDSRLNEIIAEIELRVEVELAKLTK